MVDAAGLVVGHCCAVALLNKHRHVLADFCSYGGVCDHQEFA